ncbi:MAG TPA: TlpA disulfide reductase family protein [Sphingomicrobium sp.]|nr:TlpA disulfide reductase family protein [Sphingomicrobium sp.]
MRLILLFLALSASLTATAACNRQEPAGQQGEDAAAAGIAGVHRSHVGNPIPDIELRDADDAPASLADLKGKPLLVNLWATWCGPCVKELPTLEELGQRPGAPRVIALSQDMAPRASVDAFLEQQQLTEIEAWHDPAMAWSGAIGAQILPTTVLYDSSGREVWRYVGDLDWTGGEARKLLAEAR